MLKIENICRYGDLHTHTTASDGKDEPIKLVEMAKKNKLSALAITDHDTVLGIKSILDDEIDYGIELIAGVEVSVDFNPIMHILGLFVDVENEQFNEMLSKICRARQYLIVQAFRRLSSKDIKLNLQDVMKKGKILSVNDLAEYLVREKFFSRRDEVDIFFEELWREWRNALPTPKTCIDMIHQANGVAILAHPVILELSNEDLKKLLLELKSLGLDGIEINHPNHSDSYKKMLRELATEMDLLVSGGSDYHGKPNSTLLSNINSDTVVSYEDIIKMKKRIEGCRK